MFTMPLAAFLGDDVVQHGAPSEQPQPELQPAGGLQEATALHQAHAAAVPGEGQLGSAKSDDGSGGSSRKAGRSEGDCSPGAVAAKAGGVAAGAGGDAEGQLTSTVGPTAVPLPGKRGPRFSP